jgi:hypothetical protein
MPSFYLGEVDRRREPRRLDDPTDLLTHGLAGG